MCGLLYLYSLRPIKLNLLESIASEYIQQRGPDYSTCYSSSSEYIYQSVLSIQSNPAIQNSFRTKDGYILYNGEAYCRRDSHNPIYDSSLDDLIGFSSKSSVADWLDSVDSMHAIIEVIQNSGVTNTVRIHRDPQGEKHLFYFFTSDTLMVSSVPGVIRDYLGLSTVNADALNDYIARRHFIYPNSTAIDGIKELKPGESLEFAISDSIKLKQAGQSSILILFMKSTYYNYLSDLTFDEYLAHFKRYLILLVRCLWSLCSSG